MAYDFIFHWTRARNLILKLGEPSRKKERANKTMKTEVAVKGNHRMSLMLFIIKQILGFLISTNFFSSQLSKRKNICVGSRAKNDCNVWPIRCLILFCCVRQCNHTRIYSFRFHNYIDPFNLVWPLGRDSTDTAIKWVQFSNSGNADLMGAPVMNVRGSFDYDWKVTDSIGFREILNHW